MILHPFLILSGTGTEGQRAQVWIRDQSKTPLQTPTKPHPACFWINILQAYLVTGFKPNWSSRTRRTNGQTVSWHVWRDGWRPTEQAVPLAILSTRMMMDEVIPLTDPGWDSHVSPFLILLQTNVLLARILGSTCRNRSAVQCSCCSPLMQTSMTEDKYGVGTQHQVPVSYRFYRRSFGRVKMFLSHSPKHGDVSFKLDQDSACFQRPCLSPHGEDKKYQGGTLAESSEVFLWPQVTVNLVKTSSWSF